MNKNVELLSPAGDLEIFKAVVNAKADAVYFGGDLFGARAYAKNFSIEDAQEAIKYAHLHGAKAYLTVNTLLKNLEIEKKLYDYLKAYVEAGIDAFIVQDFGVFCFIKEFFPKTAIHASTQMTIANSYGAAFLERMGAQRIVTSRELSISEIANIHKTCPDLEIESFIHGALCVCYSGQCLMSSMIGGRSGNRGRCAQPCRLNYQLYDSERKSLKLPGEYALSPKDFCTIESLPQMLEAGVMSLKIEGRMKQINYATGVVSLYRKYLDKYLESGTDNYKVDPKDYQRLLDHGNRSGFTDLYLKEHNGKSLITFEAPSHSKSEDALIMPAEDKIKVDAKVFAKAGKPFELTLSLVDSKINVNVCGNVLEESQSRPATAENIVSNIGKMGETSFVLNSCDVELDDNVFLPVSVIKNARREALNLIEEKLLEINNIEIKPFVELKEQSTSNSRKDSSLLTNLFVVVSTREQFEAAAEFDFVGAIAVEQRLLSEIDVKKCGFTGKLYLMMPAVLRADKDLNFDLTAFDGVVATSFDCLEYLLREDFPKEKIVLDHRLYTFSNRAVKGFEDAGFGTVCAPFELSLNELKHRNNAKSQFILYSRVPLMVTANCQIKNSKGCNGLNEEFFLKDRKGEFFPGRCNCESCYNIIYNCKTFSAFDLKDEISKLAFLQYRIDFSFESSKETREVLTAYKECFIENNRCDLSGNFTKGHLNRGVE